MVCSWTRTRLGRPINLVLDPNLEKRFTILLYYLGRRTFHSHDVMCIVKF